MKQKCNLKQDFFKPDFNEQEIASVFNEVIADSPCDEQSKSKEKDRKDGKSRRKANKDQSLVFQDKSSEFMKASNEVSLIDIQKHFKRLTQTISKVLCTREVERKISKTKSIDDGSTDHAQTYFKLSQEKGHLKPNETLEISIYFVGSEEGKKNIFSDH